MMFVQQNLTCGIGGSEREERKGASSDGVTHVDVDVSDVWS